MVAHQEFYDKHLKQQYEGAKVSPTIMATVLNLFQEYQVEAGNAAVEGASSSDKLWQILSVAREFGYDPMEQEKPFTDWLREELMRLGNLTAISVEAAENQDLSAIQTPKSEVPVYSDQIIFTQEGQTVQSARRFASREREMHGPNTRVFFCAHQPGEPCVKQCKEVPFSD